MEDTTQLNIRISKSLLWDLDYIAEHRKVSRNDWLRYMIADMISGEVLKIKEATQREYAAGRVSEEEFEKKMGFKPPKELKDLREKALGYQQRYIASILKNLEQEKPSEMQPPIRLQEGIKLKKLHIKKHNQFKDKTIKFKDKLTVIQGGGAKGKTIIFNLLKKKLFGKTEDCDLETKGQLSTDDPDLIFVDSSQDVKSMLAKTLALPPNFLQAFCKNLKQLGLHYAGFMLQDQDITMRTTDGKTTTLESLPAGEKALLFYASLKTVRELTAMNDPLILDCPFSAVSQDQFEKIHDLLKKMDGQIIIFTRDDRLKADVKL